jgi:cytoskeletal protein RodZ
VELPKPPWYRRFWVIFLAANLVVAAVLAAAVIVLWPRAAQPPGNPTTTAAVEPQAEQVVPEDTERATTLPTSTTARLEPGVLWQQPGERCRGGRAVRGARPLAGCLVV